MNAFVEQLVRLLLEDKPVLSRNRHHASFDNPEGQYALRISRRLKSLRDALVECHAACGRVEVTTDAEVHNELTFGTKRRKTVLSTSEYRLLLEMKGVGQTLETAKNINA